MNAPTEVGDLDIILRTEEEILGLDIAMDDMFGMTVPHGRGKVRDEARRGPFAELSARRELLVQLAARTVLQYEINILIVEEVAVHAQYVSMSKVGLDFNLPP